jgi:REP element-mobilizing transposase RayT
MAEYRRKLPHFHPDDAYLLVTWRLHGSLPTAQPDVVYATPGHAFLAQDRALDRSHGPRWLGDSRLANSVAEIILAGANEKKFYELIAWAVMPNHVHILALPKAPLPQITQWIKGRAARAANLLLRRAGEPFRQHESYDHWARNARERDRIAAYIEDNPVSAGLVARAEDWRWSSAGWAG